MLSPVGIVKLRMLTPLGEVGLSPKRPLLAGHHHGSVTPLAAQPDSISWGR